MGQGYKIMKYNINFFKSVQFVIILLVTCYMLLVTNSAQAQVIGNWEFLEGIVPCGLGPTHIIQDGKAIPNPSFVPCTVCHFYKLAQNIINFLLFISASLVTLMAIYIAFLFLFSGGNPKMITDAKSKLWLLVWGLVWVLASWLVLNTIITEFADPSVFPKPWHQISC